MKLPPIVIDPGHGGADSGTTFGGVKEDQVALAFGEMLGHFLREGGYDTAFTRRGDIYVRVENRADIVQPGDIFVSCHVNAGRMGDPRPNGLSVWYHDRHHDSIELASRILSDMLDTSLMHRYGAGRISDKTMYHGGFHVLRESVARGAKAAVLVELGFIGNPQNRSVLTDERKRNTLARACAHGIHRFVLAGAKE